MSYIFHDPLIYCMRGCSQTNEGHGRSLGPFVKVDCLIRSTVIGDEEKEPFARFKVRAALDLP